MTQDNAEGLRSLEQRTGSAAANEEFTAIVTGRDDARRGGGWDPYEVWRTRVRKTAMPARPRKDRPHDLRR
jgi:hypothetical protein